MVMILLGMFGMLFSESQATAVTVYQEKIFEFRGAWVATVSNIDISRQTAATPEAIKAYQEEFLDTLDVFEEYNMNTVIFQVRPLNDAFYQSAINPWSRFLIGLEGRNPGWDPMAWMIEECHKRNMEFHAWLNPYRASLGVLPDTGDYSVALNEYLETLAPNNFAKLHPNLLVRGMFDDNDSRILLNPCEPQVRQHIYDTIEEIVRNYDVDAIHFDDYFYNGVAAVEDDADYQAYISGGGSYLTKGDWRREQVNILIKGIHDLLTDLNVELSGDVEFGVSPAGVWAPADNMGCGAYGQPGGMTDIACLSYSSYVDLFADTKKWVNEEWLDYILPQNYGSLTGNHPGITSWWANEVSKGNVKLYIGLAPYQYINSGWAIPEMDNQMLFGYDYPTVSGFCFFSIKTMQNVSNSNLLAALNILKTRWSRNALNFFENEAPLPNHPAPVVTAFRNANHVNLSFEASEAAYGYVFYRTVTGETFNSLTEPVFDTVLSSDIAFIFRSEADNLTDYTYYVRTVYDDGTWSPNFQSVTTGIYDYNEAPDLSNLKIQSDFLVFPSQSWVTVTGDVVDANGDELMLTLDFNIGTYYSRQYTAEVVDGTFSVSVYIPPYTVNGGHFVITASDGMENTVKNSNTFYTPASKYTDLLIYIITMDILTNDSVDGIYGG